MDLKSLNKKTRNLWLVLGLVWFVIFSIIAILFTVYTPDIQKVYLIVLCVIAILLLIFWSIIYPLLRYHYAKYGYSKEKIIIEKGVFFHHRIIIPTIQIQDLHITQGPFMLMCNLAGVIISTAGSTYCINGLTLEEANKMVEELENNLKNRIEEKNEKEI